MPARLDEIPFDFNDVRNELVNLEKLYGLARDYYRVAYPRLVYGKDVRLTIFSKCINTISSASFGAQFVAECMLDEDWWQSTKPWSDRLRHDRSYNQMRAIREYNNFLKGGLITLHFSNIESGLRDIIRVIIPAACNKGTADYHCIYTRLFNELEIDPEYKKLFELYSVIRNSVHNNGIYFPKSDSNKPREINYKGVPYVFVPKKTIRYTKWDFVFMLIRDCKDVLVLLLNHRKVSSRDKIMDSYASDLESIK